jgi:type II secretory pathway pseudopilin PulG
MRFTPGMTIVEILVVILIVTVLAALTLPALQSADGRSGRKSSCGNNQRQIVLAMLVYANENDGAWPSRLSDHAGRLVVVAPLDKYTTIGSFEFLAAQTGKEMPTKVFACPTNPTYKPARQADPNLDVTTSDISHWCLDAAASASANPGYVYDWSVPSNALSERVVTADRCRGSNSHKNVCMACFGDGHVNNLKQLATTDPTVTPNIDDAPCVVGAINPDAQNDDVYTGTGDGNNAWTPGKGSATRAWLR